MQSEVLVKLNARRQKLAAHFAELENDYFTRAQDDDTKTLVVEALNRAIRGFSIEMNLLLNVQGCPGTKVRCPDGSCMQPDEC
jgi:hypothetical protein